MCEVLIKFLYRGIYQNEDSYEKTISYIYRCEQKKPLPIYAYGTIRFPPTYESLCQDFHTVYDACETKPLRHLWHFIASSLEIDKRNMDLAYRFCDAIAQLFAPNYQVCYSFHPDKSHPHFHFIVSSVSYIDNRELTRKDLDNYLEAMESIAVEYGISLQIGGLEFV